MDFVELIFDFIVKMRCENEFDSNSYHSIKDGLQTKIAEWKNQGSVPNNDVVAVVSLIEQLVGGNRFFDEETAIKAEDASIEIIDLINQLSSDLSQKHLP